MVLGDILSEQDDYRLPAGMERVGYDADTQRYTFKDQRGQYWTSPAGSEFGELTKGMCLYSGIVEFG